MAIKYNNIIVIFAKQQSTVTMVIRARMLVRYYLIWIIGIADRERIERVGQVIQNAHFHVYVLIQCILMIYYSVCNNNVYVS